MVEGTNLQVTITATEGRPDGATASQVSALADRAHDVDGVAPLSEQPLLRLADAAAPVVHLTARTPAGDLVGYAQVDTETASAELVVDPAHRRRGTGRALLDAARTHAARTHTATAHVAGTHPVGTPADAGDALKVWAHGDLPPARAFAAATGLVVVRELRKLRLTLADRTDATRRPLPPGTTLRPFVPGQDEEAWVRLNARAFAHHPEQGRLTVADVQAREREPWFDPAGFLLAERDGVLVGSVWTKVHPAGTEAGEPVGEIYVVGVDPDAQGTGLGAALTSAGLDHLASRDVATVVLYVDADNTAAVRTYDRQGFVRAATDVMLASDTGGSPTGVTMGS